MALAPCIECKKEISTEAATCPHCGKKSPTLAASLAMSPAERAGRFGASPLGGIIGGVVIAAIAAFFLRGTLFSPSPETARAPTRPTEVKEMRLPPDEQD